MADSTSELGDVLEERRKLIWKVIFVIFYTIIACFGIIYFSYPYDFCVALIGVSVGVTGFSGNYEFTEKSVILCILICLMSSLLLLGVRIYLIILNCFVSILVLLLFCDDSIKNIKNFSAKLRLLIRVAINKL